MKRALWIAAATLFAAEASAQQQPPQPGSLPARAANQVWVTIGQPPNQKQIWRASFSYRDAVDGAIATKLASGLPNTITMRAYVFRDGSDDPVALAVRTCRIVYDLWDEVYRLKVTEPGSERDTAAINLEGVLRQCAEARDLTVVDRALLRAGTNHFLGVIVEVNPVSPQMLEQLRRWLSRPTGSTGIGPSDALFGSFVGLFIRQIGASDKTVKFKTPGITP